MPASMDREIDILMKKLMVILLAVGGADKDLENGKKKGKQDKFLILKQGVMAKLSETCELMEKVAGPGISSSADPKAVIKRNQDVRTNLRALETDWTDMDAIFQAEKNKSRSKMSKDEMAARKQLLVDLKREIAELKAIHQQATVGASAGPAMGAGTYASAINVSNMGPENKKGPSTENRPSAGLSAEQHSRIQQIRQRSKEMENTYLTKIEEHVDRLGDLARGMGEELVLQDRMLDDLGNRIDSANTNLTNVNLKMKTILKQVRAGDKFCMDMMCVLMLLGMAAVLYAVIKQ